MITLTETAKQKFLEIVTAEDRRGCGLRVIAILLTHTHPDHWADYDLVKDTTGADVFCHPAERLMPTDKTDRPLADGNQLSVGAVSLMVIHTPGHTPGSCCFLVGRHLISGDTLFPGGPGRTSGPQELQQTIASITGSLYPLQIGRASCRERV